MSTFGIVVAAGSGERFGRPKALVELLGRPLWQWAAEALGGGGCDTVVVVGDVPGGVPGGARRRDSVALGLAQMPEDTDYVVIHDAARPLASAGLVGSVLAALRAGSADGVVPAIAVRDTIKQIENDEVVNTVDRSRLRSVQTPQGFRASSLREAHQFDDEDATDDAVLIERWGGRVSVVPGEDRNLKVTYPSDLTLIEALAR